MLKDIYKLKFLIIRINFIITPKCWVLLIPKEFQNNSNRTLTIHGVASVPGPYYVELPYKFLHLYYGMVSSEVNWSKPGYLSILVIFYDKWYCQNACVLCAVRARYSSHVTWTCSKVCWESLLFFNSDLKNIVFLPKSVRWLDSPQLKKTNKFKFCEFCLLYLCRPESSNSRPGKAFFASLITEMQPDQH